MSTDGGEDRVPFFVGRVAELDCLQVAAEAALRLQATTVVVHGPPGIGKSALLDRFAGQRSDFTPVLVSASEDEPDLPYSLITQLVRQLPAARPGVGGVDRILGHGDPVAVGMAVLQQLSDAAQNNPVLLMIDDLAQADPESTAVVRFVLRRLFADRICAVVAVTDPTGWPSQRHHGQLGSAVPVMLEIEGLGAQSISILVRRTLGNDDAALVERLLRWTAGNPRYLRALLADASWLQAPDDDDGAAPQTLVTALAGVVERLSPQDQAVLRAMAVLKDPTTMTTMAAISGLPAVGATISTLIRSRLIVRSAPPDETIRFVSDAHRAAVLATMDEIALRSLHRAAADHVRGPARWEHLVRATAAPDDELAAALISQADSEAASASLVRAAQYALWSSEVAASQTARMIGISKAVRLLVRAGRESAALALARQVADLDPSWQRSEAQGLLAVCRGQPALARDALGSAEAAGTDAGLDERARMAIESAVVASILCSGEDVVAATLRARNLSNHPEIVSLASAVNAYGQALISGPTDGLRLLVDLPDEPTKCSEQDIPALTYRGLLRGLKGNMNEAITDLTVATRRRESTRSAVLGVSAHIHLAWCKFAAGQWEGARQTVIAATEMVDIYGRHADHSAIASLSAIMHSWRGETEAARGDLATAERLARTADFLGPQFHQRLAAAAIAWAEDDHHAVLHTLSPLLDASTDADRGRLFAIWWLPSLAASQLSLGRLTVAARTIDELGDLDAIGISRDTAVAWLTGRLLHARGDINHALEVFEAMTGRPDFAADYLLYGGPLLQAYAATLHAAGRHDESRRTFQQSVEAFDHIGAATLSAKARREFDRCYPAEPVLPTRKGVLDQLTAKEQQVATFVGRGWTSREIADELYISTKTVEYHLRNTFIKLDLTNRRELRNLLQPPRARTHQR